MSLNFDDLDTSQQNAVRNRQNSLLILAGPGTGKTEVLKHRVADLILREKISPEEILAVTFTRKASEGMTSRLKMHPGLDGLNFPSSNCFKIGGKPCERVRNVQGLAFVERKFLGAFASWSA